MCTRFTYISTLWNVFSMIYLVEKNVTFEIAVVLYQCVDLMVRQWHAAYSKVKVAIHGPHLVVITFYQRYSFNFMKNITNV